MANDSQVTLDKIKVHFPKIVARFQQPLMCRSRKITAGLLSLIEISNFYVWKKKDHHFCF